MKKTTVILSLLLLTSLFCIKAKEKIELTHRHDVKLNLGSAVFFSFPEVSYEFILAEHFSVGGDIGFGLDAENTDGYSFKFTPFARWFFGDRFRTRRESAIGFFLEGNIATGLKEPSLSYKAPGRHSNGVPNYQSKFVAGLGLALGWKFLPKSNWTGELFVGLGHNFIYDEKSYVDADFIPSFEFFYPRLGISIGKRF